MLNQYDKLLNCIKKDSKEEKQDFLYRIDERGICKFIFRNSYSA